MSNATLVTRDGLQVAKMLREVSGNFQWLQGVRAENEKSGPCGCVLPSGGRCGFVKNHEGKCQDAFSVLRDERDRMLGLLSSVPTLLEQAAHCIELVCELNSEIQDSDPRTRVLLQFIASLTVADHLGDVAKNIQQVLKRTGLLEGEKWVTLEDLNTLLAKRGVTTLMGTSLGES